MAQKLAATLVSMGIKSMFMPPTNALHGDLGIVDQQDSFIFLSKSGESEELLNLIPFIRNKGALTMAVVSSACARMAKACDHFIHLPLQKELCLYNMIPTTSTELQLIFGDILAVALMQKKELSLNEFALNHPAGKIGKQLSVQVKDLMLRGNKIPICRKDQYLMDVLEELSVKRCGCVLIVDKNFILEGIFTDGDLRRTLLKHSKKISKLKMSDVMIRNPKSISSSQMAVEAMELMEADQKHPFMVLPVVSAANKVEGLIKMHDILQAGLN